LNRPPPWMQFEPPFVSESSTRNGMTFCPTKLSL
jgi:hypothetical protein